MTNQTNPADTVVEAISPLVVANVLSAIHRYECMANRNVRSVQAWYALADRLYDACDVAKAYNVAPSIVQCALDRAHCAACKARRIRRVQLIGGGL